ncbi:MAG TPA: P27 family phage terminase small subunit [Anaerolineae bacterium]|nr:P27 family phage terminase small subunit [Anaerolineae bacterium]
MTQGDVIKRVGAETGNLNGAEEAAREPLEMEVPEEEGKKRRAETTPRAPGHLTRTTRSWWRQVMSEYELESHHIKLLTLACEAWDRTQQARKILLKEGLVQIDRFGQKKAHPCVTIEKDSRLAFAKILREMALDLEPPGSRPPRVGGRLF